MNDEHFTGLLVGRADTDLADAIRDLATVLARLDSRMAVIAADVALLRSMADAERQADGRATYPQPAGWAR